MEKVDVVFKKFWNDYIEQNPMAFRISELFKQAGEDVIHDHIALRTCNIEPLNLTSLGGFFTELGYEEKNQYTFPEKKLAGKHFEHSTYHDAPKVFLSELLIEQCSAFIQETFHNIIKEIPEYMFQNNKYIYGKRLWDVPSYKIYNRLREESEYAAWLYVHGYRANHFAIFINGLKKYNDIRKVNDFIKSNGYIMNTVNNLETYGSAIELLEQSSVKAEIIEVDFVEGKYPITACFYEFTQRYADSSGKLYNGFIAASADKIFQSTDLYSPMKGEMT